METIGRYEIIEKIGQGGMGTVYKAVQPSLGKTVALKVLADSCTKDREGIERFKREARIMATLPDYSHVVQVFDLVEAEGKHFYTMEYIPLSLAEYIGDAEPDTDRTRRVRSKAKARPVTEAVDILGQLLKGLEVIHAAGVVHRDICPRNVLLVKNGKPMTAKIADFGIAGQSGSGLTQTGTAGVGKDFYTAPEQLQSLSHADERSDLYSLGVLAYRLVTGRLPMGRWKDPSAVNSEVPSALDGFILKCLEQEPEDRFDSAAAALKVLESIGSRQGGGQVKRDHTSQPSPSKKSVKYRLRNEPKQVSDDDGKGEFGLTDDWKPKQYIENDYEDNGDGTVTDWATGLIWQKEGADDDIEYKDAEAYIKELNQNRFGGYNDWRLPTIPELLSLFDPIDRKCHNRIHSLNITTYIASVFNDDQSTCWSADKFGSDCAWYVDFWRNEVCWIECNDVHLVRAVRSCENYINNKIYQYPKEQSIESYSKSTGVNFSGVSIGTQAYSPTQRIHSTDVKKGSQGPDRGDRWKFLSPIIGDVVTEEAWLNGLNKQLTIPRIKLSTKRVGRNDPCPCGSGLRYKKCCGR